MKKSAVVIVPVLCLMACSAPKQTTQTTASGLDPQKFVAEYRGDTTALYTLTNANGMEACITNFGGRVVSLMVPDRQGNLTDVVLGFDSIQAYFPENNKTDFGASIGRYANRINQGRYELDGQTYQLPQNNYGHCLHGGADMGSLGWQYRTFKADQPNDSTLVLTLTSPDGDNGFPGTVTATVTYTLGSDNDLNIAYSATTDKPTIINMTNHSYFNLSGDPSTPITDEILQIDANYYTPVDSTFMTLGTIESVDDTPFDFRNRKVIGNDINVDNEQIANGHGYDHNWVLNSGATSAPKVVLTDPSSGIVLEVLTDEPGIQIYSGNFLDGTVTGKNGVVYNRRNAICLETQHYPDSPNKPQWPSPVLRPGETYASHCTYRFSAK
ncbi:MAG: galactose mutarotase [Muribaculaceae bacterium]|nr:galactose mutarotase [Muribaculaceae bacterium]